MLGLFLMLRRLVGIVRASWRDRAFRGVVVSLLTLLVIATTFYTVVEGWSVLDSAYFAVVTGLTIGYGDFAPQEPIAKLFTMIYALLAVGLFVALATTLANASIRTSARGRKWASRHKRDPDQD